MGFVSGASQWSSGDLWWYLENIFFLWCRVGISYVIWGLLGTVCTCFLYHQSPPLPLPKLWAYFLKRSLGLQVLLEFVAWCLVWVFGLSTIVLWRLRILDDLRRLTSVPSRMARTTPSHLLDGIPNENCHFSKMRFNYYCLFHPVVICFLIVGLLIW